MKSALSLFSSFVMMVHCGVGIAAEPETPVRKESEVTLNAEYGTFSDSEGYGFVLIVSKWEPDATAEVHMVGPRGDTLTIVSSERSLRANEKGRLTVFVPYGLKGLYAGYWELVVAGKNGIHQARIEVPPAPQSESEAADGT